MGTYLKIELEKQDKDKNWKSFCFYNENGEPEPLMEDRAREFHHKLRLKITRL